MKSLLQVCFATIALATVMAAQANPTATDPSIPQLRKGISVEMARTNTATRIPDADRLDAVVASITARGDVFLGTKPVARAGLVEQIRSDISTQRGKILYIKADARSPYGAVVAVFDAARAAGVQIIGMLTVQGETASSAIPRTPQGFELSMHQ